MVVLSAVAGLAVVMVRSPLRYWVYGLLLCIPFDVGAPLGFIPRLSLVDYVSAAGLIAIIARFHFKDLYERAVREVGMPLVVFCSLFLIYSCLMAFFLHGSMKAMLRWGEFLFGYLIASLAASEDDLSVPVACILSGVGSFMAAWALMQYKHSGGDYEQTYAIFDQHNGLGGVLSLCLPAAAAIFFAQKRVIFRALGAAATFLTLLALLASYSRGAWVGIIGALVIIGLLRCLGIKSSSWFVGFGLLLIVMGTAGPVGWVIYRESKGLPVIVNNPGSDKMDARLFKISERIYYWKAAADIFRTHPWIGLGPKNYDRRIFDYLTVPERRQYNDELFFTHRVNFWLHLHNMYLQILVEYGAIGWVLWASAWALLCVSLFRPSLHPSNAYHIAFQVSGIAFLLHNGVDILFVNSFDLLVAVLLALLAHTVRPTRCSDTT